MLFIAIGYFPISFTSISYPIANVLYTQPILCNKIVILCGRNLEETLAAAHLPVEDSAYLLEELGVEKISMAGVVIMLPAAVDTGEAAVVKEV